MKYNLTTWINAHPIILFLLIIGLYCLGCILTGSQI